MIQTARFHDGERYVAALAREGSKRLHVTMIADSGIIPAPYRVRKRAICNRYCSTANHSRSPRWSASSAVSVANAGSPRPLPTN